MTEQSVDRDLATIEAGLGLTAGTVRGVERRANGDYALRFKGQRLGRRFVDVLRLPAAAVQGRSRYPERQNERFAQWLFFRFSTPAVDAWVYGDPRLLEEVRGALIRAALDHDAARHGLGVR